MYSATVFVIFATPGAGLQFSFADNILFQKGYIFELKPLTPLSYSRYAGFPAFLKLSAPQLIAFPGKKMSYFAPFVVWLWCNNLQTSSLGV